MTEGEPQADYHHRSHLPDHIEDIPNELNFLSIVDFLSCIYRHSRFRMKLIKYWRDHFYQYFDQAWNCRKHPCWKILFSIKTLNLPCSFSWVLRYIFLVIWGKPGIDSSIVEHEIKMYLDVKPVWQCLHHVYPKKVVALKVGVEIFFHVGFIYPIPLTDWVSNIVPIMKKKGTIRVCVDYKDVNHAFPKDNYPTSFII